MSIEAEIKSQEAEGIVRVLATDENYGKKFTPYSISRSFDDDRKIYDRKVEKILSMFAIRFTDIFGYEKLSGASYYWIHAEKGPFRQWFKDWFGGDL